MVHIQPTVSKWLSIKLIIHSEFITHSLTLYSTLTTSRQSIIQTPNSIQERRKCSVTLLISCTVDASAGGSDGLQKSDKNDLILNILILNSSSGLLLNVLSDNQVCALVHTKLLYDNLMMYSNDVITPTLLQNCVTYVRGPRCNVIVWHGKRFNGWAVQAAGKSGTNIVSVKHI